MLFEENIVAKIGYSLQLAYFVHICFTRPLILTFDKAPLLTTNTCSKLR